MNSSASARIGSGASSARVHPVPHTIRRQRAGRSKVDAEIAVAIGPDLLLGAAEGGPDRRVGNATPEQAPAEPGDSLGGEARSWAAPGQGCRNTRPIRNTCSGEP